MTKRILSVILALVMVAALVPAAALAKPTYTKTSEIRSSSDYVWTPITSEDVVTTGEYLIGYDDGTNIYLLKSSVSSTSSAAGKVDASVISINDIRYIEDDANTDSERWKFVSFNSHYSVQNSASTGDSKSLKYKNGEYLSVQDRDTSSNTIKRTFTFSVDGSKLVYSYNNHSFYWYSSYFTMDSSDAKYLTIYKRIEKPAGSSEEISSVSIDLAPLTCHDITTATCNTAGVSVESTVWKSQGNGSAVGETAVYNSYYYAEITLDPGVNTFADSITLDDVTLNGGLGDIYVSAVEINQAGKLVIYTEGVTAENTPIDEVRVTFNMPLVGTAFPTPVSEETDKYTIDSYYWYDDTDAEASGDVTPGEYYAYVYIVPTSGYGFTDTAGIMISGGLNESSFDTSDSQRAVLVTDTVTVASHIDTVSITLGSPVFNGSVSNAGVTCTDPGVANAAVTWYRGDTAADSTFTAGVYHAVITLNAETGYSFTVDDNNDITIFGANLTVAGYSYPSGDGSITITTSSMVIEDPSFDAWVPVDFSSLVNGQQILIGIEDGDYSYLMYNDGYDYVNGYKYATVYGEFIPFTTVASSDTTYLWTVEKDSEGNVKFKKGSGYMYAGYTYLTIGSTEDTWQVSDGKLYNGSKYAYARQSTETVYFIQVSSSNPTSLADIKFYTKGTLPSTHEIHITCVNSSNNAPIMDAISMTVRADITVSITEAEIRAAANGALEYYDLAEGQTLPLEIAPAIDYYTVRFTEKAKHDVVISYRLSGAEFAPTDTLKFHEGETIAYTIPTFSGYTYTADHDYNGTAMGNANLAVTVTYTPNYTAVPVSTENWMFYSPETSVWSSSNSSFRFSGSTLISGYTTSGNADDWACSPVITLSVANAVLSFSINNSFNDYDDLCGVYVIDNTSFVYSGEAVTADTFASYVGSLGDPIRTVTVNSTSSSTISIDLDALELSGKNVRVIFHHTAGVNQGAINISSIKTYGAPIEPTLVKCTISSRSRQDSDDADTQRLRFDFIVNFNSNFFRIGDAYFGNHNDGCGEVTGIGATFYYTIGGNEYSVPIACPNVFYVPASGSYFEIIAELRNIPETTYAELQISAELRVQYTPAGGEQVMWHSARQTGSLSGN